MILRRKEKAAPKHSPRTAAIVTRNGGNVARRKAWSTQQDLILLAYGHKGAAWCANEIHKLYGIKRTAEATQRHGTRIGVSWIRYEVCSECGKPFHTSENRFGMCKDCNAKRLRDRAQAKLAEAVVEDHRDGNSEQYRQTVRDYDAARQALCKLRRRQRSKQESYV